eukprot:300207_1
MFTAAIWLLLGISQSDKIYENCTRNAEIPCTSSIMLINNEWGWKKATSNSSQCIVLYDNPKAAQIVYDWTPLKNEANAVKSYPGLRIQDGLDSNGLPYKLSENKSIITSWSTNHTNTSKVDIYDNAWDIWINSDMDPNSKNHSAEIMIWLAYSPSLTINSNTRIKQGLDFWNLKFDLYKDVWGTHTFPTYSFLTTSQNGYVWQVKDVDVNEMLWYLVENNYLPSQWYIWAINIGVEIRQGKGQFTYQYQVDIKD